MSATGNQVNLQSVDAMFATVIHELSQIKTMMRETRDLVETNERRVAALEKESAAFRAKLGGAVAVVSLAVGVVGFIVQTGLHKLFFRNQ